jgi:hypothetical protein
MLRAFREILLTLDVKAARALWARVAPRLPQPKDDDEALVMLHTARVKAQSVPARARAYSAAWLAERELDQVEPIIASSAGAATNTKDTGLRSALLGAMSRAAEAAIAGGLDVDKDAREVRRIMLDARAKVKAGRISV